MAMPKTRRLSLGELQLIDAQISLLQERGLRPDDKLTATKDNACCCAIATAQTVRGQAVLPQRDREILNQIFELESKLENRPTLQTLLDLRSELLREAKSSG